MSTTEKQDTLGVSAVRTTHRLKASQKFYRFLKAVADFLIALCSIIILSPLFLIVAIAIKIDSKGPVFFVQKRIGKGGKEFKCIKFRSMAQEAKHDVAPYEYIGMDSHITRVGKIIRKLSIDELPQLFCILTGKMSLIGYRPSQPCENELNEERLRYDMYQIRPGISGWAQVNGRSKLGARPKKKAEFDAYYLKHFSLSMDIKIFFKTFAVLVKSEDEENVLKPKEDNEEKLLLNKRGD